MRQHKVTTEGQCVYLDGQPLGNLGATVWAACLYRRARIAEAAGDLVVVSVPDLPDSLEEPAEAFDLAAHVFNLACGIGKAVALAGKVSGRTTRYTLPPEAETPPVLAAIAE